MKNLKISSKLGIASGILVINTIIICGISIAGSNTIDASYTQVYEQMSALPELANAGESLQRINVQMCGVLLNPSADGKSVSEAAMNEYISQVEASINAYQSVISADSVTKPIMDATISDFNTKYKPVIAEFVQYATQDDRENALITMNTAYGVNAAVEATRAGQHGKGFAVVAEEVRNLAAKSAAAAKDTGALITNSFSKAELGAKIANQTASSLTEIVSGINESAEIIDGIAEVARVVQQNSATAEESSAASEELSAQSDMLSELVSRFMLKSIESANNQGYLES